MNKFLTEYQGSQINQLTPKILDYLEKRELKPKEVRKYRILKRSKNLDPNRRPGDDWHYPSSMLFNLKDKIKKPEGGILEIGIVTNYDITTKEAKYKHFVHVPQKGDHGFFFLSGDKLEDIENFPLIELSNRNLSNPFRDTGIIATYECVDEAKEGREKSVNRNYKKDSWNAIAGWDYDEMRIMGAAYNLNPLLEKDDLKNRLEEIAEKAPKEFYEQIDSEDSKIKATIKLAMDAGIISYTAHEHKYFYPESNETVALLDRREGVTEQQQFAQFLKSNVNGPAIREKLVKQIKAKKNNS